jgi:GntR family transcriptional regulator
MIFDRLSRSGDRPIERVRSWYRGDRYQVHMTLDRTMTP